MTNVIQIVIKQTSSGDGVTSTIKELGNLDKKASGSIDVLGNLGSSLLGLGKIAAGISFAGFVGAGVAIAGAAKAGFGFNNAMEQAGAKIGAFTKDAGKTADILEMVEDRASRTPFAFEEMANAAASLLPASISSGKGLEDLIAQAEILAASNPAEGLEGASFALKEALGGDFLSAIERFNLPKQMIQDLKDEGVPNLEIISQAMASMGLDADLVSALAETAEGRWSTFKDTLTGLAGTVTQPLFDTLSGSLGGLNDLLVENAPQIQAFADALAGKVAEGIAFVSEKATELFEAFQAGGVGGLAAALGIPPETLETITSVATKVGEILTTIAGYGGFGLAGILMVDPEAREALIGFFSDLWTWMSTNIPAAIQKVSDIWNNTLLPGFTEIYDVISAELLPAFQNLFDAFSSGTGGTQTLADLWTNTLQPALAAVGDFLLNTVFPAWVQLEVFLVGALSTAINLLAGYWRDILFPAISIVSDFVTGTVIPALSDLWAWLGPKIGAGIQALSDLWLNTLQPALVTVGDYLNDNIVPLLESLGDLVGAVLSKALEAFAGLWQKVLQPALVKAGGILKDTLLPAFESIWKTIKENVSPVLKDLGDFIFPLLQEGLDFVTQSIKDLIGYFNSLTDTVNSFSLPDILTPGSPPPLAYAMWDIATATDDAAAAIGGMGDAMSGVNPKQFLDAMNVGGTMHALGASNVNDLKDIFKLNSQAVMDILGSGGGEGELNALLQQQAAIWNVPPQFATDLAQANGLFGQLIDQYGEFARATRLENLGRLTQMAASFSGLGSTFAGMLEDQMESGEAAKKTTEAYRKLVSQQDELATLQQELTLINKDDIKAIEDKQKAIEKLTKELEKSGQASKDYAALQAQAFDLFSGNQTDSQRITSELATIALLEDFLASGAASFLIPADAVSQAAGITGILYDQISGQQELNRLLEEQAEREALITAEREARQKLDFLQQQLDLIKLGRELGGNLLQGINFGLDANLEDMLAAVNAITTAMVNQIDEDLGIASPSKLMFDKFKNQIGGGMVRGLMAVKPLLQGAVQPLLNPLTDGAGGQVVNNKVYNFNQTVNTNADQSTVIGDFRTMQLMAGS